MSSSGSPWPDAITDQQIQSALECIDVPGPDRGGMATGVRRVLRALSLVATDRPQDPDMVENLLVTIAEQVKARTQVIETPELFATVTLTPPPHEPVGADEKPTVRIAYARADAIRVLTTGVE